MKVLSYILITLSLAMPVSAQEWSSFQNGGKLNDESWTVTTEWSPEGGIAWQQKLAGYGQSSPVVHADLAYVTSVAGPNKETIIVEAFSLTDGKRKWIHSQANSTPQENTVMISRAAPTPVSDADGVIAMFEGGNVVALEHDGSLRWQKDLAAEYGDVKARHGLAASLEQDEKHVFIWVERTTDPYIIALRKSDGSEAWKVGGVGSTAWASPRMIEVEGSKQLVFSAIGKIVGVDPTNGSRLWEFDDIQGNSSATPMPLNDGMFLIGASGGRGGPPTKPCCGVIKIEKIDDAFVANWVWSTKKTTCSFGSPLAHDGKAYFVNRTGIVNCLDLETGDQIFAGRLPGGSIWATPLFAGGKLYFFGKSGVTSIIETGAELKVSGENKLWAPETKPESDSANPRDRFSGAVLYAATVAGDQLLLRRGDVLYSCTNE